MSGEAEREHEDMFRWCIHCKADCWLAPDDQEHASDCPQVTGVYPVTEQTLAFGSCINCSCQKCLDARPICAHCCEPFVLGGTYMLLDDETGRPALGRPEIGLSVCVGCCIAAGLDPSGSPDVGTR